MTFSGTGISSKTVPGVVVAAGPEGIAENTKLDVVPEPGALPMHVVGLATLASIARRRRAGRV